MKGIVIIIVLTALLGSGCHYLDLTAKTDRITVIPKPAIVREKTGEFFINKGFYILLLDPAEEMERIAQLFADHVGQISGLDVPIFEDKPDTLKGNELVFDIVEDSTIAMEGYLLDIQPLKMRLAAPQSKGLFYGVQTLMQLLSKSPDGKTWALPCAKIDDGPRFVYRGMHLDCCRHFFPPEFIKKYIDILAMHKLNTFHWHLTEDQGWRIEIKKFPRLTTVASRRKETLVGHYRDKPHQFDGTEHGGIYTQDEVGEIVQYAKDRYITIIPEIEMPGHSVAALAAYPELSCTGGPFEVATKWGVFEDVYCAGNEKVFRFLEDVLTEVMDLFPSKYIHIGGDECPKTRWESCPRCQVRIRNEGLKDEHELQSYFIRRIEKFLLAHDRRLIGWDEILEGGLAPEATVMSWRGMEGGIQAAKQGHNVIMTPTSHCYFDYYQGDRETEPLAIGGDLPLEKVYSLEPVPDELSEEEAKHILGAQGNVWTEYMAHSDHVEYMALPRLCALAEVVWTPIAQKDWVDFHGRMKHHFNLLESQSINFSRTGFESGAGDSDNE